MGDCWWWGFLRLIVLLLFCCHQCWFCCGWLLLFCSHGWLLFVACCWWRAEPTTVDEERSRRLMMTRQADDRRWGAEPTTDEEEPSRRPTRRSQADDQRGVPVHYCKDCCIVVCAGCRNEMLVVDSPAKENRRRRPYGWMDDGWLSSAGCGLIDCGWLNVVGLLWACGGWGTRVDLELRGWIWSCDRLLLLFTQSSAPVAVYPVIGSCCCLPNLLFTQSSGRRNDYSKNYRVASVVIG